MPYHALRFDVPAAEVERWSDALLAHGALAVDAADASAGTEREVALFGEPDSVEQVWPSTRLTALFAGDADPAAALLLATAELALPAPVHAIESVADDDWVRKSQTQFVPVHASDRIWIVPTWCEPPDPHALNLRIDPGLAFGTGSHATTRLCVRWLDARLAPGTRFLDYGCGSGVLAIAAAKLGAREVCAVDIDPNAIVACRANAAANDVELWCGAPDALPAGAFDAVCANILAQPLQALSFSLAVRVRSGGEIVLSGVLEEQSSAVRARYARWFNIDIWEREDGWVALAGTRKRSDG
jgi:ribosomal protein L11 methyltransferase